MATMSRMHMVLVIFLLLAELQLLQGATNGAPRNKEVTALISSKQYATTTQAYALCNITRAMPTVSSLKFPWICSQSFLAPGSWCTWTGISCAPANTGSVGSIITSITLSKKSIAGSIPAAIGALTALQYLLLDQNSLVGTIPSSIGGIVSLQSLHLESNYLSGTVPVSLKALTNLRVLNVNGNYMTGTLDPFFSTTFTNDDYFGTASTYTELNKPTGQPTSKPTFGYHPSYEPTLKPSQPTGQPTTRPSGPTRSPTLAPTAAPSQNPTKGPSATPSVAPTRKPSVTPTVVSVAPTAEPTPNATVAIGSASSSSSTKAAALSAGAIAGIVIGAVFGLACCFYLGYYWIMPSLVDPGGARVADAK